MTHNGSKAPQWSSPMASESSVGPSTMGTRVTALFLRPTTPPLWLGVVVAISLVAVETLLVYGLNQFAPGNAVGALFLLGVLVVSAGWGFGLAVMTTLASALVYMYFHLGTDGGFVPARTQDLVAVVIFVPIALLANVLVGQARLRAAETDQRRREADLAAELARLVLRAGSLHSALDRAAQRLAEALGLPFAALEMHAVPADERRCAIPLCDDGAPLGTLLVPAELPEPMLQCLRERVVPSLEALLRAARDREAMSDALEASRKELERFFDLSSDLLGIANTERRFIRVNAAFERARGRPGELLSRPVLDFVHPDDRDRIREELDKNLLDGCAARFENRFIRNDGSVRWLEWNVMQDQDLLYCAARDVTERRREQEQQAALRRVATLVARGVSPSAVFSAVADELARCLDVSHSSLVRFEADGASLLVASHDEPALDTVPVERFPLEDGGVAAMVYRTGCAARLDSHENVSGLTAARARRMGLRSAVGTPITVEGRVWGAALVSSSQPEPLPLETEAHIGDFADLVATAIANADTRSELMASRARIVAAGDDARRRLERDLHDGAQQRLVSLALELRAAEASLRSDSHPLTDQISDIISSLTGVSEDLREISRGIHPAILSRGGLGASLKALARRSAVPVQLDLDVDRRMPEAVEVAGYYVVAEALTNAAKHAKASEVTVIAANGGANLRFSIRDDGIGGADPRKGSGLVGLSDRIAALGGELEVSSAAGEGTCLLVHIPFEGPVYR